MPKKRGAKAHRDALRKTSITKRANRLLGQSQVKDDDPKWEAILNEIRQKPRNRRRTYTEEQYQAIRRYIEKNQFRMTQTEMADDMNVGLSLIHRMRRGIHTKAQIGNASDDLLLLVEGLKAKARIEVIDEIVEWLQEMKYKWRARYVRTKVIRSIGTG